MVPHVYVSGESYAFLLSKAKEMIPFVRLEPFHKFVTNADSYFYCFVVVVYLLWGHFVCALYFFLFCFICKFIYFTS